MYTYSWLKSREITWSTKVRLIKAMIFPVVTYGCKSWSIKKAEHWRSDAFELSCWRRLLRVPWTARRSNQSIIKELSPGFSLEGLMLKLKLQYFGHLMWRADSLEKTLIWERLKAGEGDDRGWDGWMASLTHWTWALASSGRWWSTGKPGMLQFMGSQRVGHDWASEQQKIINPSGYCFMQDKIWAVLTSCPYWFYDLYQSFFLIISVFGMSILFAWICLKIFFPGKNAKLPKKSCLLSYSYLASLDSANFFDNLKPYHSFSPF